MKTYIYILVLFSLVLTACDTYTQDEYMQEYVVESYLIAGEPLPVVKLSQTSSITTAYSFEEFAVSGATVRVSLTAEDGSLVETFTYVQGERGIYQPTQEHIVEPLRRYDLEIIPPEGEQITASTLVPGVFTMDDFGGASITYQESENIQLNMTHSEYPGRPAIYLNKVEALDTTFALTPLYQDLVDDDEVTKEDLIDNSSGIMNEANFESASEGQLTVIVPWIGIAYYGPNDLVVDAVDDNVFDFLRSIEENGVRPLGERENVIDHVTGARGIFGSLARARTRVFVNP